MERIFLILLTPLFIFSSCKEEPIEPTPRSEVLANIVGAHVHGYFNMIEFWKYDGTYDGPGFQLAVVFKFTQDGSYEYYFAAEANSYGCKTNAFTYHKGSVVFNDNNSFTIYPQDGNFRGFYNCTPSSNFNRKPTKDELKSQTFYYSFEEDSYGEEHLVIRFNPEDAQGSYFRPLEL